MQLFEENLTMSKRTYLIIYLQEIFLKTNIQQHENWHMKNISCRSSIPLNYEETESPVEAAGQPQSTVMADNCTAIGTK